MIYKLLFTQHYPATFLLFIRVICLIFTGYTVIEVTS